MITSVKFLVRLTIFWLAFFFFFRILFFLVQFKAASTAPLPEIIKIFYHGIRLDLSCISYTIAFPALMLLLQLLFQAKILKSINRYFHAIVIFCFTGFSLGNISLFKTWGTIMNARAFFYLSQPEEVYASISNIEWLISFSIWAIIFILFYYFYRRFVQTFFPDPSQVKFKTALPLITCCALIALGARGGIQLVPISESSAYFSTRHLLNQMATNPIWFLGHSLLESQITNKNPYHYADDAEAQKRVKQLYDVKNDSTILIFNVDSGSKPNVVIIMLESWSADIIKALHGEENVTPNFNLLAKDGILFDRVYSSGFRTDQGIVSVLSGFPAQPNNSIIRHPDKTEKLPSVIREFKNMHYNTSFYYGGEIGFANMNSYLLNSGCDKLVTEDDFDVSMRSTKWGVYDEHVLNRQADDLNLEKEPFLSILLTLNTHEPFEVPIKNPFGNDNDPDKFRGAAYYTDQCLGNYFKKVRSAPWFNNTIFILLADHGHRMPKENDYDNPAARRMTMMFYGNLIKTELKGSILERLANQNDFASTLLAQLDMNHAAFTWSNNIFNTNRHDFAYISLDFGLSWVLPENYFIYHFDTGKISASKGKENINPDDVANAKAYIQCLYKEFLEY